jgi:hypothetical protein
MIDKPKFREMRKQHLGDEMEGYFEVLIIKSNGQDFTIDFADHCVAHFTVDVLDKMKFILEDAFYRLRPDLRRQ